MLRIGLAKCGWLYGGALLACSLLQAQQPEHTPPPLVTTGQVIVDGRSTSYRIRHLPVTSFPDLPEPLAALLTRRGCLIPQTYQARRPENVIHASLERPGSSDWAVLCSKEGMVSLLVFFSSSPERLQLLASAPETERLQVHDVSGVLGFNWGIDPASPKQIFQTQSGMGHRPPLVDHDALADTIIDHRIVYHFYLQNAWTELDTPSE
jgi:hypothetical protein